MAVRLVYFPCHWDENWRHLERLAGIDAVVRLWPERGFARYGPTILFASQEGETIKGVTPLSEFKHPRDATYVFGPNHRHLQPPDLARLGALASVVYVEGGEYLASHTAAIAVHDRMKTWLP